jgi:hypothetical protein
MADTFVVNRIAFRRMLAALGVSDRNMDALEAQLNKEHRHVNSVALAGTLQRLGLSQDRIKNVFRRIGIDDVTITSILNTLDEEKILETFGKVVELDLNE